MSVKVAINEAIKAASQGQLRGILDYSTENSSAWISTACRPPAHSASCRPPLSTIDWRMSPDRPPMAMRNAIYSSNRFFSPDGVDLESTSL